MERRDFLKTCSVLVAGLPFAKEALWKLPINTQIAILPETVPYWNVFVTTSSWPASSCATTEQITALVKEFAPSEGRSEWDWATYWFRNKIGADRFSFMLKQRKINSWKPEQRIAMDEFSKEQFEHWLNVLNNCNTETYYYRHMEVGDEEQVRITEDAEDLGKEKFLEMFQDPSIGEEMYNIVSRDGFNRYLEYDECEYFCKKLEPYVEGSILRKLSFGEWENFLFFQDTYDVWKEKRYHDGPTTAEIRKNWR